MRENHTAGAAFAVATGRDDSAPRGGARRATRLLDWRPLEAGSAAICAAIDTPVSAAPHYLDSVYRSLETLNTGHPE